MGLVSPPPFDRFRRDESFGWEIPTAWKTPADAGQCRRLAAPASGPYPPAVESPRPWPDPASNRLRPKSPSTDYSVRAQLRTSSRPSPPVFLFAVSAFRLLSHR